MTLTIFTEQPAFQRGRTVPAKPAFHHVMKSIGRKELS